MTDKLRQTLASQAGAAALAPVDLDAISADGRRAVRRRRVAATVVAGAVAAVLVVLGTVRPGTEDADIDPSDRFPTRTRSFEPMVLAGSADGGAQARSGDVLSDLVGFPDRLVRNADGLVYSAGRYPRTFDEEPVAGEVSALVDGTTTDLGPGVDLVADEDGHVVAWLDIAADDPHVVVLDTRTMTTRDVDIEPLEVSGSGERPAWLQDVDGHTLYLWDGRGGLALDLVTGTTRGLEDFVVDVEGDTVVTVGHVPVLGAHPSLEDPDGALTVTSSSRTTVLDDVRSGVLSPDGRWFAPTDMPEEGVVAPEVVDTTTGAQTTLDVAAAVPGDPLSSVVEGWLDATTVVVYHLLDGVPASLLTCDATDGRCAVAVPDVGAGFTVRNEATSVPGSPVYGSW